VPPAELPSSESLQDTETRLLPYWQDTILPHIQHGQRVLVVAHGNSLRALVRYLDNVPPRQVPSLTIPTGVPLIYELNNRLQPLRSYYLTG
jgi:2,3-bisphosphoglycerate-dependent phosphoglycerate mutase